jgi:hypothetical protein
MARSGFGCDGRDQLEAIGSPPIARWAMLQQVATPLATSRGQGRDRCSCEFSQSSQNNNRATAWALGEDRFRITAPGTEQLVTGF